jgi:SAM-dependent methyltransferase
VDKTATHYDQIGRRYSHTRRPDPAHRKAILRALRDARSVVNVGAGTGSYEPSDRTVVAVEPSEVMIAQRPMGAAPVVRARAEALPFRDASFAAALAILTVHHWEDPVSGLREMRRVAAERAIVFSADIDVWVNMWLVRDYFPEIVEQDRRRFPTTGGHRRHARRRPDRPAPNAGGLHGWICASFLEATARVSRSGRPFGDVGLRLDGRATRGARDRAARE